MTDALDSMTQEELSRLPRDEEAGPGSLATERGPLPLAALDVRARVVGLTSEIELRQTFDNKLDEAIEATYVFPLPDRAAVTRFRMLVGERVIDGVIQERAEARRDYERALEEGHRAAITEEERPGVFTMRVGNLMPGERAVVELVLSGPLPLSDGEATFRFPLVVAPRYVAGAPLPGESVGDGVAPDTDAVPDASRVTPPVLLPGQPNPVELSLRVDLDPAGLPISNLRSSLHAVADCGEAGRRRVELRPGERLDRDFVLRFTVGDRAVRTSLALTPDEEGEGGTFSLTVVPPAGRAEHERPRDVVFVLDRSGSMTGWKVVAARRAVSRMVDTLNDRDRFAVLAFDNRIETPPELGDDALSPATDRERFRAVEFLARLEGRGGTEMARPLERAASLLGGGYRDRERVLVLVTDGQVAGEDQVLEALAGQLAGARVFTLGIDRAVNEGFLKRLAALGGGACELVESEDRLDEVMERVHRRIGAPVVTELSLEPRGLEIERDSVVPGRPPDLFTGAPIILRGRFRGAPEGEVVLRGQDDLGDPWEATVAGRRAEDRAAAPVWARGRVRELEDRYAAGEDHLDSLATQIVELSLRFGVLCRFTAFLAVDRSEKVHPAGNPRRVIQPVEAPSGWEALESGGGPDMLMASMASMASAPPPAPEGASAPAAHGGPTMFGGARSVAGSVQRMVGSVGSAGRAAARLFGGGRGRGTAPADFRGFAERIDRLLEQSRPNAGPDPVRRARALAVALAGLLQDLGSVDAPAQLVRPLEEALDELRGALAAGEDSAAPLGRVERELERAGAWCSRGGGGAPPARGKAFWK